MPKFDERIPRFLESIPNRDISGIIDRLKIDKNQKELWDLYEYHNVSNIHNSGWTLEVQFNTDKGCNYEIFFSLGQDGL